MGAIARIDGSAGSTADRRGTFRQVFADWDRRDWRQSGALLGVIALMHVVGFVVLLALVAPHHYHLGSQVFGIGLGVTAYTLGLRHAFDADHIAAIDNTTRKLMADGKRPKSVGFWFAMGHSTMVFVLAALVVLGAHVVGALVEEDSPIRHTLGMAGTLASGSFLYLIGILNVVALVGIWRVFKGIRRGHYDAQQLDGALAARGFLARILGPLMRAITRPVQMYPVGLLFGIGFDTATEVTLLALAGAGAATGLPWYAVLLLPLLFAAGMSGMDTFDGLFMTAAYDWAFAHPVRRVYYNMSITGLSVAVALVIGSIELISVLHDDAGFSDPVTGWIAAIDLNYVGFAIVGLFIATWLCAVGYWKLSGGARRWQLPEMALAE